MLWHLVSTRVPQLHSIDNVLRQWVRHEHRIKMCGFLEPPEFKKRDIRYKITNKHKPKLMSWQDYQLRKWKADHHNRRFPAWQARMDYAESLVRLGMSWQTICKIVDLHPHCIKYIERKVSGNIELLREAEYCNYVNFHPGVQM
ncbi:unnamed protein product [Oppiella nova]|uniref:Uncharacterized protein n=1 Tax=Oppiella nova TaxID=334625 RepID=A0A7R9MCM5_9ACAR|nr:unnamed protein product [Oppiella nova]CAG2174907.1 unnamed protein product [Oppiella nova]